MQLGFNLYVFCSPVACILTALCAHKFLNPHGLILLYLLLWKFEEGFSFFSLSGNF